MRQQVKQQLLQAQLVCQAICVRKRALVAGVSSSSSSRQPTANIQESMRCGSVCGNNLMQLLNAVVLGACLRPCAHPPRRVFH